MLSRWGGFLPPSGKKILNRCQENQPEVKKNVFVTGNYPISKLKAHCAWHF